MFGRLLGYLSQVWLEEKPSPERGDRFALGGLIAIPFNFQLTKT